MWRQRKAREPGLALADPLLTIIPPGKADYDVNSFFPLFSNYIYQLCNDMESIKFSTTSVLQDFRDDGVIYLELRTTPREIPSRDITKDDYVSSVLDCIKDFGKDKMSTYLILSVDRRNTEIEAMEVVDLAVKYQSRGVVAVDLCGDPSQGRVSLFRAAFAKAKHHGLKLTLHFAEVPSSSVEEELMTLLSYKPERIGHVIHVSELIRKEIVARKLGLELCLSCNVHARLIPGGFSDHHFGYWRDSCCPLILCTDDVGVFCSPLSNEYLLAAEHFNLSHGDIVDICGKAIEAIFGDNEEKKRLRESLSAFKEGATI